MPSLRLAAALAAASFALLPAAAHADPLVDGCYGAVLVVCDPYVSAPVGFDDTDVPVCTGTCTDLHVPTPGVDVNEDACATWTDRNGAPGGSCANVGDAVRYFACQSLGKGCTT